MEAEPKKQTRASHAEVASRVDQIMRLRLHGAGWTDCITYAQQQGWGVTDRQVGRYIAAADDLLVKRREVNRRRLLARHIAQRETLYQKALKAEDYRASLAILADLAKLQALYSASKDVKELVKLAAEQGRRIQELEARLADTLRTVSPVATAGLPSGSAREPTQLDGQLGPSTGGLDGVRPVHDACVPGELASSGDLPASHAAHSR